MDTLAEYKEIIQRMRHLRAHAFDNEHIPQQIKELKPKYLEAIQKLYPTVDNSAMSAKFS